MKLIGRGIFVFLSLIFLVYLSLPNISFPDSLPDSKRSMEPADSETTLRRAYFTNFSREEVLDFYQNEFKLSMFGFDIPSYKLVYPPEDAYPLIRDQTRSTHLEEIVYPFRESFFVNEFVPKEAKDDIWYKGKHYEQKITVKIVNSSVFVRVFVGFLSIFAFYLFWIIMVGSIKNFSSVFGNIKNWW